MMNKRFFILLQATLLLGACEEKTAPKAVAFSMSKEMQQRCERDTVKYRNVRSELRLFGNIAADNNNVAQIDPVVSGLVKEIRVELGDYVQQGQVLAIIQSREVAGFRKELLDAVSSVEVAEKKLLVARELHAGKLNSEKDIIVAEKKLEREQAELARIREIYKIYSLSSGSDFRIVAPISGFVVLRQINKNEQIKAENDEPLFRIARIDEVWALANVSESDISKVKLGQQASIRTLAFPDRTFEGKIDKIFNAIDPSSRSMKVRISLDNPDYSLKPDMHCVVNVYQPEKEQMLSIPASALIFDRNRYWTVVYRSPKETEIREVSVFTQSKDLAFISRGLEEHEVVISKNALLIYNALTR